MMTNCLFNDLEQGTPEWLVWRKKGLGGSEIGAAMGLNPYCSPYQLWCEKTGRVSGEKSSYAINRGTDLEPKARALYELLYLSDMQPRVMVHPEFDFMRVSLDGISDDGKTVLEIKCPASDSSYQAVVDGEIKPYYMAQMQYQLFVSGAEKVHFFNFRPECDPSHVLVEVMADDDFIKDMVEKVTAFWQLVKTDTPPELTDEDFKILDSDEAKDLAAEMITLKGESQTKETKLRLDELKQWLLDLAEHGKARCGKVSVSRNKKGSLTLRVSK